MIDIPPPPSEHVQFVEARTYRENACPTQKVFFGWGDESVDDDDDDDEDTEY